MSDNPLSLSRDEDVSDFEINDKHVSAVRLTDENRLGMLKIALSMYLGERCKYCTRIYKTLEDLNDTVWAGCHDHRQLACKPCWKTNNPNYT